MIFIMAQGIMNEPIIDFRDYKIGTDLKAEKEKIAKNPSEYKTFYSLKNSKTSEIVKVNQGRLHQPDKILGRRFTMED